MADERDEIRACVYPRLRALCAARGLFLHIGDLRWGIRDDEVASGQVVRLCLREVERSNYFVGLLKGRYGWHVNPSAPEQDESNALFRQNLDVAANDFPWVREWADRSVTEIEIRAGTLRDPEAARGRTLFFFADDVRPDAKEGPYASQRLEELKNELRRSGFLVSRYHEPLQVGMVMLDVLSKMVELDYPMGRDRAWLRRQQRAHSAFGAVLERVFAGDPPDFVALDEYAGGSGEDIFVLHGEDGSGKSSLLANWAAHWADGHPEDLTITHFIGATQDSSALSVIARRIGEEVKQRWPDAENLDCSGEVIDVVCSLRQWLGSSSQKWPGRVVIVLDGLDLLQGPFAVQSLAWLPDAVGPLLRIVLSCVSGAAGPVVKAAQRLPHVATRELVPLSEERRRELALRVLQEQGRTLSEDRLARVVAAKASASPLFLRTLLEELSAIAVHATLDAALDTYLACESPRDLFRAIFRRLASRYKISELEGSESPVAIVARAILLSRHGMSEEELSSFAHEQLKLGRDWRRGMPVMAAVTWNALWYELLPLLVGRGDTDRQKQIAKDAGVHKDARDLDIGQLFSFRHLCVAEAAELEFDMRNTHRRGLAHRELGRLFAKRQGRHSIRRAEEAPWAFSRALAFLDAHTVFYEDPARHFGAVELWKELADSLCTRDALDWLDPKEAAELWDRAGLPRRMDDEACTEITPVGMYADALHLNDERARPDDLERAARVLVHTRYRSQGLRFLKRALAMKEQSLGSDHPSLAKMLDDLARLHQEGNDNSAALEYYERALAIKQKTNDPSTADTLYALASIHQANGKPDLALSLHQQALVSRGLEAAVGHEKPSAADTLGSWAKLHQERGEFQAALRLFEQALAIRERLQGPEHPCTAAALQSLARLHRAQGDHEAALPLHTRALAILEKMEGPEHPSTAEALHWLASLHHERREYDQALPLYKRALEVKRATKPLEAATMHSLGKLYRDRGELIEAARMFQTAFTVRQECLGWEHHDTKSSWDEKLDVERMISSGS
eukprot:tig00000769_g4000.t1